jgi:excisionase family DNA binding protein
MRSASLETASQRHELSVKTLRRMIARGELTGYRVGKRMIRVDLAELDSLLRPIPSARDAAS